MKKKKMKTEIFAIVLSIIMAFTMISPLTSPARAAENNSESEEARPNGYIPFDGTYTVGNVKMVKDFSTAKSSSSAFSAAGETETLPKQYRSDKQPWAEGIKVKDQESTGLCWAYSMSTAAEYSYAKEVYEKTGKVGVVKETSPVHLGQFSANRVNDPLSNTYGDANYYPAGSYWPVVGNNQYYAMQHLASWSGLALEEKYPASEVFKHIIKYKNYPTVWDKNNIVFPASAAYDNEMVQQETILLFDPVKDEMKKLCYKYGAISTCMEFSYNIYMNPDEIDPETDDPYLGGRSYYNCSKELTANHAVTIVGWDDNYPKENFSHVLKSMVEEAEKKAREEAKAEALDKVKADAEEKIGYYEPSRDKQIEKYVKDHLADYDDYVEEAVAEAIEKAKSESRKKTTPDADGAWVVQNSWSDVLHDDGFFYVSYESIDFNSPGTNVFAFDMQPADTYKYNFQYDGNMSCADASDRTEKGRYLDYYTKPGTRAANVFTNTTGEAINLEAVGYTTFTNGNQKYDVSVYTGLKNLSDPTSGTLQGKTSIAIQTMGCKTAVLNKPVYIAPGDTYSIVFDFTDFSAFGTEVSADYNFLYCDAEINPGQSFFSSSKSGKWVDMNKYAACFRIKGFANPTALIPDKDEPAEATTLPSKDNTSKVTINKKLPVPKIGKVKRNKKSANVQWKKLSAKNRKKISGFEIQYSTGKSFKKDIKTVFAKAKSKSKKITGLKAKKKYYVRIRTYKKTNKGKQASKWSKKKIIKVK